MLPIGFGQVLAILFGLIGVRLVTFLVEPGVYGTYTLFLTATQIGTLLTHPGLTNHASRRWHREASKAYLTFLWQKSWALSRKLGLFVTVISLAAFVATGHGAWLSLAPFLFVANLAAAIIGVGNVILNAAERFWPMFWSTLVTNAARALAPAGVAALFGGTLFSLGVGFTLTQIIGLAALAFIFPAVIQMRPGAVENPEWHAELESYGKPFLAIGVGGWLLLNTDRWIVALAFDESRAGIFGLAANMSGIIPMFVAGGLMQLVFPRVFRDADQAQSPADWRRLARRCDLFTLLLFLGAGAGLVFLWMAGPQLIGRLFPEKYRLSIPLFIPAGFAILASQINQFHYLLLQSKMNSDAIVRVMLATALVKVAGSIVAISISWPSYLGWLICSPFVIAWLGRLLIHRHVFPGPGKLTAGPAT